MLWRIVMSEVEVIEYEIGKVIEIENSAKVFQMPKVFGRDFKKLIELSVENGCKNEIRPYARYVDIEWEKEVEKGFFSVLIDLLIKRWHFFSGINVDREIVVEDDLQKNEFVKSKYLQLKHIGPYSKVGASYKKMVTYAKKRELILKDESFEFYLNSPDEVNQEKLETLILIPIER